jgi:EAL domain-containing protein (putative c-di-GMP-specific phosphodiesterase class I)/CheY-like chemotaxis protein
MSTSNPSPADDGDARRVATLEALGVIDGPADAVLDGLVRVASSVTQCPMALVTLVGAEHQWVKSHVGWDPARSPRTESFCTHAIIGRELMEVPDALMDSRFRDNPWVVGAPHLRYYAGVPIEVDGSRIGTLCVYDTRARQLDELQRSLLHDLARGVQHWMLSRRQALQAQGLASRAQQPPETDSPPARAAAAAMPAVPAHPAPLAAPGVPEYDEGMLVRLVGSDPATLARLRRKFLLTTEAAAQELRGAVNRGDAAAAAASAHRLKSSSRTVGAMVLGQVCHEIEHLGSLGHSTSLPALLPAFEAALQRVVERIAQQLDTPAALPAQTEASTGVLLVDDESFQLQLMSQQLAALGVAPVHGCTSGAQALDWLDGRASSQILLLLDLNMPGMDGVQFMRHLVSRRYAGALALISGADKRVLDTAARLAGAHDLAVLSHLQKPVQPEALQQLIDRWRSFIPAQARQARKQYSAADIAQGIEAGELVLHYQPKVAMGQDEVIGVEALVRWQHPRDGLVYPDAFVAAAEAGGCIDALTTAVLGIALQQARRWRDAGQALRVAVNVSMDNLERLDFASRVLEALERHGVPPGDLTLELTESLLSLDRRSALDSLTRLRLNGVGLSIDDFGTGHSSLAQLRDFPFDELKIDRGFVHGCHSDATQRAIFTASLEMAHQLGLQVVAEGVEDAADWRFCRGAGCDAVQGYFVARPMPAADLPAWRQQWQARHTSL